MYRLLHSWGLAAAIPLGAMALALAPVVPAPRPAVSTPTQLTAQGLYLKGTKSGYYTDDDTAFVAFANAVVSETFGGTPFTVDDGDDPTTGSQIEYNGGFWPFSLGGLADLTFGASVAQGVSRLEGRVAAERAGNPAAGVAPNADTIVAYGYSQGAVVVGRYKAMTDDDGIAYVLLSNPARPNGGMLSRFQGVTIPILDIPLFGGTPISSVGWDGRTPTTYDIARQYDGWPDFPKYPVNILATANALLGMLYLHGTYEYDLPEDVTTKSGPDIDRRVDGDTVYLTVGTDLLPLLRPLEQIGVPKPLLLALDAPLRVLIEQAYDRTTEPGAVSGAGVVRIGNPFTGVANVLKAIPVGIDDGLEASGHGRPLGTRPAGMYGVGGPEVPGPAEDPTGAAEQDQQQQAADAEVGFVSSRRQGEEAEGRSERRASHVAGGAGSARPAGVAEPSAVRDGRRNAPLTAAESDGDDGGDALSRRGLGTRAEDRASEPAERPRQGSNLRPTA